MHMQNGRGVASRTPHACLCAAHSSSTAADRLCRRSWRCRSSLSLPRGSSGRYRSQWHSCEQVGVLAYTCRIWEEPFSLTQKGIALEGEVTPCCMSMCWYIQICFQLNIFGGYFRLLVSSCLLHPLEEDRCSSQKLRNW